MSQDIKIAVLGAPGVGISSLIHRFAMNDFVSIPRSNHRTCWRHAKENQGTPDVESSGKSVSPVECVTSTEISSEGISEVTSRQHYNSIRERCLCSRSRPTFKTIVYGMPGTEINFINLTIVDVPSLSAFPADTLQEWDDVGARGVRSASVFVLVFDINKQETFEYVKKIQRQIKQCTLRKRFSGSMQSSVKKSTRIEQIDFPPRRTSNIRALRVPWRVSTSTQSTNNHIVEEMSFTLTSHQTTQEHRTLLCDGVVEPVVVVIGNKSDTYYSDNTIFIWKKYGREGQVYHKEASHTARKSWKSKYIECSAKYGINVRLAFLTAVEEVLSARGMRKKNKCKDRASLPTAGIY